MAGELLPWQEEELRERARDRQIATAQVRAAQRGADAEYKKGTSQLLSSRLSLAAWLKPLIVGFLVLLFLIGPGLSAVRVIIGSMQWYVWVGILVFAIYIFKYR